MGRRIAGSDPTARKELDGYYRRLCDAGEGRHTKTVPLPDAAESERGELPYDQAALHARWDLGTRVTMERTRLDPLPVAARIPPMEALLAELGLLDEARALAEYDLGKAPRAFFFGAGKDWPHYAEATCRIRKGD